MAFLDSFKKKIETSEHAGQVPLQSAMVWPRLGQSVEDLAATQQIKVFVDASFIKSHIFRTFSELWHARRTGSLETRVYFIPSCELKKLSDAERSLLIAGDYRELLGDTISDCFTKIRNQNLHWTIAFLTTNEAAGYTIQAAARTNGLKLRWYGIDSNGKLCSLYSKAQQRKNNIITDTRKEPSVDKPFKSTIKPVSSARSERVPKRVPATGDRVFANGNGLVIYLKAALMTDSISVTYATDNPGFFAKVYRIEALQIDMLEQKAARMLQEKVEISGVCWPADVLKDHSGCFVGILVPVSRGVQLTRSVLNGATGLSQYFPQWNKRDICILAETILDKICKMHDLGILFGCINPATIYIVSPKEVYFVDTDCWQIEGYPALSRNQTFTPPELLRDNKVQMIYTTDQENYQIALLTFMLMMPGKFPYAKGKDSNERDSIIDMAFPFSVGGGMRRSQDAERPSGIWRIVWDHLPYQMCNGFYNTFHSTGKYARSGQRLSPMAWLQMTKEFSDILATANRADSRDMFPRTFRRDGKRVFARCSICGQEHPDYYFMHSVFVKREKIDIWQKGYRICLQCAGDQSNVSFKCECCGRQFYYTNRTKVLHEIGKSDFDFKNQKWCRDCKKRTAKCVHCGREVPIYQMREFEDRLRNLRTNACGNCFKELIERSKQERENWKNSVDRWIRCRSCGRSFSITNGDVEYFSKKGWNLPTSCPECRKRRY